MKLETKHAIIVVLIICALLTTGVVTYKWIDGWMHFAGSYPYAETYDLNYAEAEVIKTINKLKIDSPELALLPSEFEDGRKDSTDYWYNVYFSLQNENKIIFAWTRPLGSDKTSIGLVSFIEGKESKDINKDYGFFENRRLKKVFENKILSRIQDSLMIKHGAK